MVRRSSKRATGSSDVLKEVCRLKQRCTPTGVDWKYLMTVTDVMILNHTVSLDVARRHGNIQGVWPCKLPIDSFLPCRLTSCWTWLNSLPDTFQRQSQCRVTSISKQVTVRCDEKQIGIPKTKYIWPVKKHPKWHASQASRHPTRARDQPVFEASDTAHLEHWERESVSMSHTLKYQNGKKF